MSDNNNGSKTLRDLALRMRQAQSDSDAQKKALEDTQRAEEKARSKQQTEEAFLKRFEALLRGFDLRLTGIRFEHPDFEDAYAVLDDFPGLHFYLGTQEYLRAEAPLPEHPKTPEYEDWWENTANHDLVSQRSAHISTTNPARGLAALGDLLSRYDHLPTIKPWPPKPEPEPAAPAPSPVRFATLRINEANAEPRPFRPINALMVDGSVRLIVEYTD